LKYIGWLQFIFFLPIPLSLIAIKFNLISNESHKTIILCAFWITLVLILVRSILEKKIRGYGSAEVLKEKAVGDYYLYLAILFIIIIILSVIIVKHSISILNYKQLEGSTLYFPLLRQLY